MVRWKIAEMLRKRGWTAYRLAQEADITLPATYRLAKLHAQMGRVEGRTLDKLCAALECQPGDLLEHVPDKTKRKRG